MLGNAPSEHAALLADSGDPIADAGGLSILPVPVVCLDGLVAGLPLPDSAVRSGDHGLVLAGGDPACFYAVRQTVLGHAGSAV